MNSHPPAINHVSSPLLVSVPEAAELLGIGRTKLYELILSGEIATVTIGRARRVPVVALRDFVESLRNEAVTASQGADTLHGRRAQR